MTDKDTMPTPGPWRVVEGPRHAPDECDLTIRGDIFVIATIDGPNYAHCEANADLIAAAGTAAHEVKQMGFDPVEAVKALPDWVKLARALEWAGEDNTCPFCDAPEHIGKHDSNCRLGQLFSRAAGKEGESHE